MKPVARETLEFIADLAGCPVPEDETDERRLERLAASPISIFSELRGARWSRCKLPEDGHVAARARLAAMLCSQSETVVEQDSVPSRQGVLGGLERRAPSIFASASDPVPQFQAFEPSMADRQMAIEASQADAFAGATQRWTLPVLALAAAISTALVLWLLIE